MIEEVLQVTRLVRSVAGKTWMTLEDGTTIFMPFEAAVEPGDAVSVVIAPKGSIIASAAEAYSTTQREEQTYGHGTEEGTPAPSA